MRAYKVLLFSSFIETRRTEEIAYISSYKVGNSSHSVSQTSSFDRITVIDKQDKFSKICKDFEERFLKTGLNDFGNNNRLEAENKTQKKRLKKALVKSLGPTLSKENNNDATNSIDLTLVIRNGLCQKIENDEKNYKDFVDKVPSPMNIDASHYLNYSELTSVCSKTNNDEHEMKIECLDPVKEFCIYSDNSGSSKAEIIADEQTKTKGKLAYAYITYANNFNRALHLLWMNN